MSRVKVEIDDDLDFDLEDGDMILHIKHNGDIGKVCMPDMNPKVKNSVGYNKMLQVLEILIWLQTTYLKKPRILYIMRK